MFYCRNFKSKILFFENLRGIIRQTKSESESEFFKFKLMFLVEEAGTSSKIFHSSVSLFFPFLLCRLTTELCAPAVPDARDVPFAGAFAVSQLTDKVNAGVKPPECTACPDVL